MTPSINNASSISSYFVKPPFKDSANFHKLYALIVQIEILKIGQVVLKIWGESIAEQAKTSREDYKHKIRHQEDLNWEETLKMRRFELENMVFFSSLSLYLTQKDT